MLVSWFAAGVLFGAGCASGPSAENPVTAATQPDGTPALLSFTLRVNPNGAVDTSGRGYYVVLFNAMGDPIEVTDVDTFTDFMRFDGRSLDWFHRQANLPNPGFSFVQVGSLNQSWRISDAQSLTIVLDNNDPNNLLNQFITAQRFSAHLATTDNFQGANIGRILDTLGQGPGIDANSLQTVQLDKVAGALNPLPQFFPDDPINDWIARDDLGADFPFPNFDVVKFEVNIL
ncbi:MAG: hypothetical protein AB1758_08125 [Candidatus Eremiobacterota bacterium]